MFTIGEIAPLTCLGCGATFIPTTGNQDRCKPHCGRKSVRVDQGVTRFIAVDGEGVTLKDGTHHYVLLSVGDQSYHRDGAPLHYREIFQFLWSCYTPNAAFVGYFLGYDFTMWLKTLPVGKATKLLTTEGIEARKRDKSPYPFPVDAGDWEFDIMNLRRFKLRPRGTNNWMTICDAGSFFQTSFLNAIDPAKWVTPIVTDEEWAVIVEGKSARSTATFDPAMIRYNVAENTVMSRLMGELDKGFIHAGVRLSKGRWFGPGQAATVWLDSRLEHGGVLTEELHSVVPGEVLKAAKESYYGGWFDIFAHGHVPGTTYEYDINSAYPKAISSLPCLKHGRWIPYETGGLSLVYAEVESGMFPVMPHRDDEGHILRPGITEGWFWEDELLAAVPLDTTFHVKRGHTFVPGCDCTPYAGIEDLYYERLEVGKNTPHGMAIKLLINSCYGKFAQSVGAPKHGNAIYASLITSETRRKIIEAIASHPRPEDCVMVATDGVYFRSPHPDLEISPTKLGAWDAGEKKNLTLFMPGVYWDDAFRKDITKAKLRSRGVSARDLAYCAGKVDEKFDAFDGEAWPEVEVPILFGMVSARQALHRGAWNLAGHVYSSERGDEEAVKSLSSNPRNKRIPVARRVGDVWRTRPYAVCHSGPVSKPYDRKFGIADSIYSDLLTPDGVSFGGFTQ